MKLQCYDDEVEDKNAIVLVDDDLKLAQLLKEYVSQFGFELAHFHNPKKFLDDFEAGQFQLVLLDVMMPGMDGFEVCRKLREKHDVPIIMLTARGETTDRVLGLELGADDYLPKPFEPRELVARIQTILRRRPSTIKKVESFGTLTVDSHSRVATLEGKELDLTTTEFETLKLLASSPGKKFSRDEIMNHLQGVDSSAYSRSIDVSVSRLRQKLGDTAKDPKFIKTIWGTGYVFVGERK